MRGLATSHPHPLQQAFIDEQAAQCGYCMNGMVMTAKALLGQKSKPQRRRHQPALEGELCRCGSHLRVIRAIKRASGGGKEEERKWRRIRSPEDNL